VIVCVEGPSAVGKTTASRSLALLRAGSVIPEVNARFTRPPTADDSWYLERQEDRWAEAKAVSDAGGLAVLDGDPFQPLWYNWSFNFHDLQSLSALRAVYRPRIERGLMRFPDLYVLLLADSDQLRQRKTADTARARHNFDRHLRLLTTMPRYFEAVSALNAAPVTTVDASIHEDVQRSIVSAIDSFVDRRVDAVNAFDAVTGWLADEQALTL
jgi:thymidylate kinase